MEFTQLQLLDRANKVHAIKDIYKKEDALGRKRSDFYMMYDHDLKDILFYDSCLGLHMVRNMRKERAHKFGISRH